jgi:two-component system sensor histidine kinase/response regulator
MAPVLDPNDLTWRTVSQEAYDRLKWALVQRGGAESATVLCDRDLSWPEAQDSRDWQPFTILVTPQERAMVVQSIPSHGGQVEVGMTCQASPILAFLRGLVPLVASDTATRSRLDCSLDLLTQQPTTLDGSGLLLALLPFLQGEPPGASVPGAAASQPQKTAQGALVQQQQQDVLLHQVITKIRNSLELTTILSTTVAEVRQQLQADRLLIYQCQPAFQEHAAKEHAAKEHAIPGGGTVAHESRRDHHIPSLLSIAADQSVDRAETAPPPVDLQRAIAAHWDDYPSGNPIVVPALDASYGDRPEVLAALRRLGVQAQVIAPIWIRDHLWGFLIAHQYEAPRTWQPQEQQFVQQIAEHLGVAIQQAGLYQQIREQAHSLEACVVAQTQGLQDALIAAQAANRTKSEFLAAMSHELRTPLTCIIGMSATLLRWSFGDLSPRQRDYLTTIHTSGERLLALINDILELSKIESGRTALEVRELSLSHLAHQCWESFRKEARDRDIDITYDVAALTDKDTFVGDPRRIRQIINNLLSNALKFTDAGGHVNLRLRREQKAAVFQVEDTGIGIPANQQSLLFETFQQLETGHRRQYQGTGLGLALTKQLVELHGGTITVNSRVGVGSVFTVRLPYQRLATDEAPKPTPAKQPSLPVTRRIVLVEDREETARVICDLLTAADYQVIWVIEGSQVLEQVALLQPSIIIVNLHLASVDGQHIIQELRQSLITTHVKILGLAVDAPGDATDLAVDALIQKPLNPENLLEQINALLAIAAQPTPP